MGSFKYSCVVDSGFKFQIQAQNLISTLVELARVPGRDIIVHTVSTLDPELTAWLQDLDVVIQPISPFAGHAYCNKLQQLSTLSAVDEPFVVMMDCDTVVSGPLDWPEPQYLCAKRVDTATPPRSVLSAIFEAARLGEPEWVESDLLDGAEGRSTARNIAMAASMSCDGHFSRV